MPCLTVTTGAPCPSLRRDESVHRRRSAESPALDRPRRLGRPILSGQSSTTAEAPSSAWGFWTSIRHHAIGTASRRGEHPLRRTTGGLAGYGHRESRTLALGYRAGVADVVLPLGVTASAATLPLGAGDTRPDSAQRERSFAMLTVRSRPSRSLPLSSEIAVLAPS